jgi:KAP-like P-loop domain-containing protein/CHAT domain-containing protein
MADLVVSIERAKDGFRAIVKTGELDAVSQFALDYGQAELQALWDEFVEGGDRHARLAEDSALRLGSVAFDGLFGGDGRSLVARAQEQKEPRLWLRLPADPDVQRFPWELLHDRESGRFLARTGVSILRSVEATRPPARSASRPLKVLFAGANPSELSPLDLTYETEAVARHLRDAPEGDLELVEHVSLEALRDVLARSEPQIVHLVTHARRDSLAGEPQIAFEDSDGNAQWVGERQLGDVLGDPRSVQLVLIIASTESPGPPVGAGLLRGGVSSVASVVSLQFPIDNRTASQLVETVYQGILAGESVDAAVARGRRRLAADQSRGRPLAWAAPVIHAYGPATLAVSRAPAVDSEQDTLSGPATPRTPPSRIEVGTLDAPGSDAVGDEDQLGFSDYVTAFADLITSPYTRPPLTIGIFGTWGMGKSFLLEHIEREITRRQTFRDGEAHHGTGISEAYIVRFNAWEYSASEIVWPGLVRKILSTLDKDVPWPRYKRWWTRLRWNLTREFRRLRAPLAAAGMVVAIAVAVALWRNHTDLAKTIAAVVAALGVGGLLKAASDPVARWVTTLFAESNYGRQIGYMEDIKHDLETLERRLHKDGNPEGDVVGRILVLIDDLDRCEPEKAVEMLQAVNLLLNFSSFIVCLGIDARIVTGAVEKHYAGLLGRTGASGYEYLDKIVQIPFRIPEPGEEEIKTFIGKQLGDPQPPAVSGVGGRPGPGPEPSAAEPEQASSTPMEPDATSAEPSASAGLPDHVVDGDSAPEAVVPFTYAELQAFQTLASHLRPNPRHLKRLVNVYRLVRALARAKGDSVVLEHPAATIRWLVMWGQWPYTSHAMLERFEQLLDAGKVDLSDDHQSGEPLIELLDGVETQLDAKASARLDDDLHALRALLSIKGYELTWDQLRRIRRYTLNFNPAVEEQLSDSHEGGG